MDINFKIRILCHGLFSLVIITSSAAQVHMSANVFVNENDSVPVTCNTTEPADIVTFFINNTRHATILPNNDCRILNSDVTCSCESITVITCMTLILNRSNHGHIVEVHAQYGQEKDTAFTVIYVIVPIKQVIISPEVQGDLFINASDPVSLSCGADGIPTPRIDWFLTNTTLSSIPDYFTMNITSSSFKEVVRNPDSTDSVSSNLTYIVNKTDNGMWLYCSASNVENTYFLSRMIQLNVQYKPQEHMFINDQLMFANYYMIRKSKTVQMLKCSVHGGNPLANISWTCYDGTQSDDNTKSSAIRTVTWLARYHNDSTCICKASHILGWTVQKAVSIHVYYEPYSPKCNIADTSINVSKVNVTLTSDTSITCVSDGNPPPNTFTWTLPSKDTLEGKNLTLSNVQKGMYTISAENTMTPSLGPNVTGHSNTTLDISVHYGPRNTFCYIEPNRTNLTSKTFKIIKGEEIGIGCFADASPPAMYVCSNKESGETLSRMFHDDTNISCSISNTIYPTGHNASQQTIIKSFQIRVLYPPNVPVFRYHTCNGYSHLNKTLFRVVSGYPLNVTCFAEAKPEARYRWKHSQSSQFYIANVSISDSDTYVCIANNIMNTSYGKSVEGLNESSFDLDVLYPPTITNSKKEFVVIENTEFILKCQVSHGNPDATSVSWNIIHTTNGKEFGQNISFPNISRTDKGNFTCVVNNTMRPTGCNAQYGIATHLFTIDVQYKATISSFFAVNETVIHKEELRFECNVDSDPPANVSILSRNGTPLNVTRGDNQLQYKKTSSCLEDIGNFTCISSNKHNARSPDSRNVTIDVKCSPIYRPHYSPETVVKSDIGEQTILNFSIFSNPLPTSVIWTNLSSNLQLHIITSQSDRVFINTSKNMLSSVVFITSTETWDFGNYSVRVENEMGDITKTFSIILNSKDTSTTIEPTFITVISANYIGAVVGGSVGAISGVVIIAVVIITIFYRRVQRLKGTLPRDNKELHLIENTSNESGMMEMESFRNILPINDETQKYEEEKNIYANVQTKDALGKSLTIKTLRDTVRHLKLDPLPLFKEFYTLHIGLQYGTEEALKPNNVAKNRYRSVYPYDASRVVLPFLRGDPDSDFINASYIDGYCKPRKYIAAQGPLENTINDTWRMIYSEDVKIIVMVTNLIETEKRKCIKYWPDDRATYGKCNVKLDQVEEYADFVVRHLTYSMEGTKFERQLIQFHYTSWPDKNVPATALSLVQFWRKVRQGEFVDNTPWMVHCSAGVGRTGTFIALDYLYDQGKVDGKLNVRETVNVLREQRISMVQTKEQYLYLHEAITELLDPVGQIFTPENSLRLRSTATEERKLNKEFKAITSSMVNVKSDFEENDFDAKRMPDGLLPENICKSIDKTVIPDDHFRPLISTGNNFINAVFIPTYRDAEKYIVTQYPLQNTVLDFVWLLWDHSIDDVVLLDVGDEKLHCYWPQNKSPLRIGPFVISLLSVDEGNYCTIRRIDISLAERRQNKQTVVHQFTAWPVYLNLCEPKPFTDFLQTISRIGGPFVVQCHDGYSRSGLFAALLSIVDRIKTDKEVAIADTVRVVKHRRHAAINDVEQYQFCHEVVFEYLKNRGGNEESESQEYVNMTFPKFL